MQPDRGKGVYAGILFILLGLTVSGWAGQKSIATVLYEAINSQGVERALEKYHRLYKSEKANYNFAESELNSLGYRLLSEGNKAAALRIFRLNVEMYPESPNVYDSLGEAYMRRGENEQAILNYEKALSLLSTASIDEQRRAFLKNNAEGKLRYLKNPESYVPSTALETFIAADSEHPFGKPHPDAPSELRQWGQLAGVWRCINYAFVNGQWFSGWEATWAWRYALDGFAVQDIWIQKQENLPPPSADLNRDFIGTNWRIYDIEQKKWEVVWLHNGQRPSAPGNPMSRMQAEFANGQIIMTPVEQPASGPWRRIVFHNMTHDRFDWKAEKSEDDGQTWVATGRIEATRVR